MDLHWSSIVSLDHSDKNDSLLLTASTKRKSTKKSQSRGALRFVVEFVVEYLEVRCEFVRCHSGFRCYAADHGNMGFPSLYCL